MSISQKSQARSPLNSNISKSSSSNFLIYFPLHDRQSLQSGVALTSFDNRPSHRPSPRPSHRPSHRPLLIKVNIGFGGDRYYNAIKRRIASV
ncbi:hypothetical protein QUB19_10155 [Microcoleus sp. B4-C5]|uniref:hypothetical protein n=1 Tax=unclassified Microcoleus TaxID=2642155 RepID=UPI002FD34B67